MQATERSALSFTTLRDFTTVAALSCPGTLHQRSGSVPSRMEVTKPNNYKAALDDDLIMS
jgi:hypothetical protein